MASKCTCPSCKLMFNPTKAAAGKITCPMCKAKIPVASANARSAIPDDEDSPAGGRQGLVVMAVAGLVFFLLAGAGLGMYLLKGSNKDPVPNALASQAGTETPAPTPVVTPAPIERPGDPPTNPPPVTPPAPVERPDPVPSPPPALDPVTAKQVKINAAIDRGSVFLKKKLDDLLAGKVALTAVDQPMRDGFVSFMAMTLLECGTAADDPLILKAATSIREKAAKMTNTYAISTSVLFLERLGDSQDLPTIKRLGARLIVGQQPIGNWAYECSATTEAEEQVLWNYLTGVDPKLNFSLPGAKEPTGVARALPPRTQAVPVVKWLNGVKPPSVNSVIQSPISGDNSNTQFALLALWVSARNGLPVRAPLAFGAEYFATIQAPDGGWSYQPRHDAGSVGFRSSMTCAGLLAVALGRGIGRKPNDKNVELGFKFLTAIFKGDDTGPEVRPVRPPMPTPAPPKVQRRHGTIINADAYDDLYYLWSLERVALIYGLQKIGDVDWYAWESDILLRCQKADGSWVDHNDAATGTCFALLILKRVNVVKDLKVDEKIKNEVNKIVNIKE